jgi:ArsR family transcriptional regulator, arsenate/arsenite/antimonite-responsive transcriptional repressor / arsenate reductase (thioredoxin)
MPTSSLKAPAAVWLLGHDIRWRLAQELSHSDHRVSELVEAVGERQNLVSYHLGLLRRAGMVSERRSSHDSRDVYYSLNLGGVRVGLDQALAGLHPALTVPRLETTSAAAKARRQPRLLFVCTGNSARSQLAEAIARDLARGTAAVFSAGPKPAGVHPMTLTVLKELGLPSDNLRSKSIEEVGVHFDFVITLCDVAREDCPPFPSVIHWSLPDPARLGDSRRELRQAFKRTAEELRLRITYLLPVVAAQGLELTAPRRRSDDMRVGGGRYEQ